MQSTAQKTQQGLLGVLREREAQARAHGATYLAAVPDKDSMLYWLTQAAASAREAAGRKQVHVAASADLDQSTIARFEKATAWPRDADRFVAAYADDLDVDSIDLWEEALSQWRRYRAEHAADLIEQEIAEAAEQAPPRVGNSARTSRGPARAGRGR